MNECKHFIVRRDLYLLRFVPWGSRSQKEKKNLAIAIHMTWHGWFAVWFIWFVSEPSHFLTGNCTVANRDHLGIGLNGLKAAHVEDLLALLVKTKKTQLLPLPSFTQSNKKEKKKKQSSITTTAKALSEMRFGTYVSYKWARIHLISVRLAWICLCLRWSSIVQSANQLCYAHWWMLCVRVRGAGAYPFIC